MKLKFKKTAYGLLLTGVTMVSAGFFVYVRVLNNRENLCFYRHLSDAVNVNNQRKDYYSQITDGTSNRVSDMLIRNERMLMPIALLVDLRAQSFIKAGMPVVCGDFIEMNQIASKEYRPMHKSIADNSIFENLNSIFEKKKLEMQEYNKNRQFEKISATSHALLLEVEKIEQETKSNFCMSRHVVDSLGLAALHASIYSKQSVGAIDQIEQFFLKVQISGLSSDVINIDREAQKVQALGAGIVCNDVPEVPFKEKYQNKL